MNRTELIEKLLLKFSYGMSFDYFKQILEEELPDFQRIDWERLRDCFYKASNGYVSSHLSVAVNQYNSTLSKAPAQPPALVPLPKEMPALWHDAFTDLLHNRMQPSEFYSLIRKTYGTPDKPNLPSVEELAKEITVVFNQDSYDMMRSIAQHLHDKYSLHPREWWKDCEKFMHKGIAYKKYSHQVYPDGRTFLHSELSRHDLQECTPYTPPSAQDIIAKHNLSEEEIRAIREGKCT